MSAIYLQHAVAQKRDVQEYIYFFLFVRYLFFMYSARYIIHYYIMIYYILNYILRECERVSREESRERKFTLSVWAILLEHR